MYRFLCKDIRTFQQNLHWKILHDFVHDGSKLLDKNKKFYFQIMFAVLLLCLFITLFYFVKESTLFHMTSVIIIKHIIFLLVHKCIVYIHVEHVH